MGEESVLRTLRACRPSKTRVLLNPIRIGRRPLTNKKLPRERASPMFSNPTAVTFIGYLIVMVGVGVCYTDLQEIINAITVYNVVIAAVIVIGAVLGAAIGGWLMGFFPIESAITAGLCMANRGGSGDLEVLSACNRMNLISYAQISSRLGGGIVLVIASIVFGMMV